MLRTGRIRGKVKNGMREFRLLFRSEDGWNDFCGHYSSMEAAVSRGRMIEVAVPELGYLAEVYQFEIKP